jgi:hypothetical protein
VDEVVEANAEEISGDTAEPAQEPAAAPKKKRTRRGSRGGRNRKKKPAVAAAAVDGEAPDAARAPDGEVAVSAAPTIHLPPADLGTDPSANGDEAAADEAAAPKKKRTRRGSRGGRRRRKPAAAVSGEASAEPSPD